MHGPWHNRPVPAQLYTERIGNGANSLLLTHGIYGAGSNWRAIARKLVGKRAEWSVVLLDLRGHGRSEAGEPPHTVAAAADDVRAVVTAQGITAIAGHSFGGKVMLATRSLVSVAQTWVFDASPSARPGAFAEARNSVVHVLQILERSPKVWAKRDDFIAAVVAAGYALPLAQWLAMNLVPDGEQYALRLDTQQLRALLESYYETDLWADLFDPAGGDAHVVIAERSNTIDDDARARLAQAPAHVHVHRIAADHWLHIEAADAVVDLLASALP
jgi:pimeloyl-ACP methyl ester carboxylesterase